MSTIKEHVENNIRDNAFRAIKWSQPEFQHITPEMVSTTIHGIDTIKDTSDAVDLTMIFSKVYITCELTINNELLKNFLFVIEYPHQASIALIDSEADNTTSVVSIGLLMLPNELAAKLMDKS